MMKKRIIRLAMVVFLVFLTAGAASAQEKRVVRIAFPITDSQGLYIVNEDGSLGGMMYEYFETIRKYTGWDIEYVKGTAEDTYDMLLSGDIDISGNMYEMEDMKQYVDYPVLSSGVTYTTLMAATDDENIVSGDFGTLDGKTVAIYKNKKRMEDLDQFCVSNDFKLTYKIYTDSDEYKASLDNGEAELMLSGDLIRDASKRIVANFAATPYYTVVAKGNKDLVRELNSALFNLQKLSPNYVNELYNKYFEKDSELKHLLTEKEKKYIKNAGPIRMVVYQEGISKKVGEEKPTVGIDTQIAEKLRHMTGMQIEYIKADSYQEGLDLLKNRTADVIAFAFESGNTPGIFYTSNYFNLPNVMIERKAVIHSGADRILAVVGNAGYDKNKYKHVIVCADLKECMDKVNSGEADVTFMDNYSADYLMQTGDYRNLTTMTRVDDSFSVCMAVRDDLDVSLTSILEKALLTFNTDEINQILWDNLISVNNPMSVMEFIQQHFVLAIVIIILLVGSVTYSIAALFIHKTRQKNLKLNIREKEMHEAEMKTALDKAESASRAKSWFLSTMSHEIRTPMNAIIGNLHLLHEDKGLTEQEKSRVEKIQTASRHLLVLINDILDMQKIESGKIVIVEEPFNMTRFEDEVREIILPYAKEKLIKFTFENETSGLHVKGDETHLKQILINLLNNAMKYTERGGRVTGRIHRVRELENEIWLLFEVEDTGIGISEEDKSHIFEAFRQVANNQNIMTKGTGLGLSICKSLVELMGGSMELDSEEGKGSRFYFTLKFKKDASAEKNELAEKPDAKERLRDTKALMAEDNDLNGEIAVELLETKGVHIDWVLDGNEVVKKFSDSTARYYDFILMDIQMPYKDGLEATRDIRKLEREDAKTVPIIAMTANSFLEDIENAKAAGMNEFISKPINVENLFYVLNNILAPEK